MNVVIFAVKGGVAKSTTTAYLAEGLAAQGMNVGIIDADPQGTLIEWEAQAAEAGVPFKATVEGMPSAVMIQRNMTRVNGTKDIVLVDCPNRDVQIIEAALGFADLAIVPMPPGIEELRRADTALLMAERAGVPAMVLLTLIDRRTNLTREIAAVLDQQGTRRFRTHIRRLSEIAATVGAFAPTALLDYRWVVEELLALPADLAVGPSHPALTEETN